MDEIRAEGEKTKSVCCDCLMKQRTSSSEKNIEKKDGCFGWIVVLAAMYMQFFTIGIIISIGIFYVLYEEVFHELRSHTSLVGTLCSGFGYGCGPLGSTLCHKIGHRKTLILGSFIASIGLFISAFAPNLYFVIVSHGVLTGIGISMVYGPSIVVAGAYFEKHRSIAIGVTVSGAALGILCIPFIVKLLLTEFGWRGTLILLSGLPLNGCAAATIMKPPQIIRKDNIKIFDCSLVKEFEFVTFLFTDALWVSSSVIMWMIIPDQAIEIGLRDASSSFVSAAGVASIPGRLFGAFLLKFMKKGHQFLFPVLTIVASIPMVMSIYIRGTYAYYTASSLYGFIYGAQVSSHMVLVAYLFGIERMTRVLGLFLLSEGIGCLIGPPIAAAIFDSTKNYIASLYYSAGLTFTGGLALVIMIFFHLRKLKKKKIPQEEDINVDDIIHVSQKLID